MIMTIDDRNMAAEALLQACGASNIDHPGGTLFAHLRRVRAVLTGWGAEEEEEEEEEVQLAGAAATLGSGSAGGPRAGSAELVGEEREYLRPAVHRGFRAVHRGVVVEE